MAACGKFGRKAVPRHFRREESQQWQERLICLRLPLSVGCIMYHFHVVMEVPCGFVPLLMSVAAMLIDLIWLPLLVHLQGHLNSSSIVSLIHIDKICTTRSLRCFFCVCLVTLLWCKSPTTSLFLGAHSLSTTPSPGLVPCNDSCPRLSI